MSQKKQQQQNTQQSIGGQSSFNNYEHSKDNHKGISYSTLKHNTTGITNSVNNEENFVELQQEVESRHVVYESQKDDVSLSGSISNEEIKNDGGVGGVGCFHNIFEQPLAQVDTTAPLQYDEFFQIHQSSSEDQTFIQRQQPRQKIFLQNERAEDLQRIMGRVPGGGGPEPLMFSEEEPLSPKPSSSIIMPKTFLDTHLFYPQAFENQFQLDKTLEHQPEQFYNFIGGVYNFSQSNDIGDTLPIGLNENTLLSRGGALVNDQLLRNRRQQQVQSQEDSMEAPHDMTTNSWKDDTMLKLLSREKSLQQQNPPSSSQSMRMHGDASEDKTLQELHLEEEEFDEEEDQFANELEDIDFNDEFIEGGPLYRASNLKHLVNFIHGDIYHCAICSSKFEEPNNLPRVLYCGDCLCEKCIKQSIACQVQTDSNSNVLQCLVCSQIHHFKMTSTGFIICNEKFVKIRDEHGLVNFLSQKSAAAFDPEDIKLALSEDCSINQFSIPEELIIRSLPINVELIQLIREQKDRDNQKSIINQISKFIHLDQLDDKEAKYYLQELRKICDEDISNNAAGGGGQEEQKKSQHSMRNNLQSNRHHLPPPNLDVLSIPMHIGKALEEQFSTLNVNEQAHTLAQTKNPEVKPLMGQNLAANNTSNSNVSPGNMQFRLGVNKLGSQQPFRKANEDISLKVKKNFEKKKNLINQPSPQSKPAFKQHSLHGLQLTGGASCASSVNQFHHMHHHHHHLHAHGGASSILSSSSSSNSQLLSQPSATTSIINNPLAATLDHQINLHGISTQQALNLLSKKHRNLMRNQFGPGNHIHLIASKKDTGGKDLCGGLVDDNDDDEEGLDEREPEKAICPDNSKQLFNSMMLTQQQQQHQQLMHTTITLDNIQNIPNLPAPPLLQSQQNDNLTFKLLKKELEKHPDYLQLYEKRQQQLQQQQQQQQQQQDNSSSKKNKRKKKKRQKARQQRQEQRLQLQRGIQIDDYQGENDLYAMYVPGEFDFTKGCRHMQQNNLRNPFLEYLPYENSYHLKALQQRSSSSMTTSSPYMSQEAQSFALLCEECCAGFQIAAHQQQQMQMQLNNPQSLAKLQAQMTKELLEAGLTTVITHQCQDCKSPSAKTAATINPNAGNSSEQAPGNSNAVQCLQLCLLCALSHKQRHPNHTLRQVIAKTVLQQLAKKSTQFEQMLNSAVTERVRDSIDCEVSKIVASMRQIFKINNSNVIGSGSGLSGGGKQPQVNRSQQQHK